MTDTKDARDGQGPDRKQSLKRLHIDAERAAELVRRVKGERDEPFGPLSLVRSVVRPRKKSPG